MTEDRVWVLVNRSGIVVGASVANGRRTARSFLEPKPDGYAIHLVEGPVILSKPLSSYVVVERDNERTNQQERQTR